jgi:SAM-dependent methyltransferase
MHDQARNFTLFVKGILSNYFINKDVLDVGSGDINGNNRFLFENCNYNGNDVIEAPNVTIVSKTKDLPFKSEVFDTIISTECFEHDPDYTESFKKIYNMLKPGGLFVFTCASIYRPEHGTRRSEPDSSYGTIGNIDNMVDYYKNLTSVDINEIIPVKDVFSVYDFYYEYDSYDLYFVGIKKGINIIHSLPEYTNNVMKLNNDTNSLEYIFYKYDTDKNIFLHNYTRQYEELLKPYKNQEIKLLEIGVGKGGSLKAFNEYFKNSKCIIGLDINETMVSGDKISVETGDVNDNVVIYNLFDKYRNFDIILDDGSHLNSDVINTFEKLFPLLNDGGVYIVEDTICYKYNCCLVESYPNHLEYFFKYIPFLNQWRVDDCETKRNHCVDPFKISKKTDNIFEYSIDKIEFGVSYIAIHKKIRKNWIK